MKKEGRYQGVIISQMFRELLPVQILSVMVPALGGLITGVLTGNYLEADAMVALGFVIPMTTFIGAIAAIVAGGAKVLCGRYMGRGDNEGMEVIFSSSIITAIVIGGILTLIGVAAGGPIAMLLGAKEELVDVTAAYVRGISIGIIPMILSPLLMAYLQIENESNYTLIGTVVLVAGNLVFGLLNILCFGAGVFGMGLASSVSQFVAVAFLALRFRMKKNLMHFVPAKMSVKESTGILVLGSPAALAIILFAIRNIFINKFAVGVGGAGTVNVLAILNSAGGILDAFNNGIGMTTLILASVFVGERDSGSLKNLLKTAFKYTAVIGGLRLAVLVFGGRLIARLFGAQGDIIDRTYTLFLWYGTCIWFNMISISIISIHQSLGRVRYTSILYVFSAFVLSIGWLCLTSSLLGETAIWTCYIVAETLTVIILLITAAIKNKAPIKSFGDILWLDDKIDDGNGISESLRSMEEVINLSKKVAEFCIENGVDGRRARLSGLCLEEMAGNVIEHGFTKGKNRGYTVDVYVGLEGDDVVMHIRSNTPEFDPGSRLNAPVDDPCKNIGIRMVSKIAKEMNYRPYFGMNVETIRL